MKEKLNVEQINKECEISSVGYWLRKFNILQRSKSEICHISKANHCNLSKVAIEWISGELLGDGYLYSQSPQSANFLYGSKYLEYINYISNILKSFGVERVGKINKTIYRDLKCCVYRYASRQYEELLSVRKKWYPEGKK